MADNSSNSVAIIAIVILVIAALGVGFYFFKEGRFGTSSAPTKVEVNVPSTDSTSN